MRNTKTNSNTNTALKESWKALDSLKMKLKSNPNAVLDVLKQAKILSKSGKVSAAYTSCK
jgi:hypothetical protein